jgi:23S rRNA maturation-related 3'-5' exoribonuclease YhaM
MPTPVEKMTEIAKRLDDDKYKVFAVSRQLLEQAQFDIWSGSSQPHQHHYGKGGLAQHTLEVAELCLTTNAYYKPLGKSCEDGPLFMAAVFHDAGKMYDYQPVNHTEYKQWEGTKHKRLIHQICAL